MWCKQIVVFFMLALPGLLVLSGAFPSGEARQYQDKNGKISYHLSGGMFNGEYISYYPNGKEKAAGSFSQNMRSGTWTVWDSTGRMKQQRLYGNSFEYRQLFPLPPKEGPVPVLMQPVYQLHYNQKGFIDWFPLQERAVMVAKRLWRTIKKENNPALFGTEFCRMLRDSVLRGSIDLYKDDEFWTKTGKDFLSEGDTSSKEIVAFKIKEDWFFDNDRMISECRIIGICPVLAGKSGDTLTADLGWLYFPQLRPLLATLKITNTACPPNVHTVDDLFFFRYFRGELYKYNSWGDLKEQDVVKERERVELSLLEEEHGLWISFSK